MKTYHAICGLCGHLNRNLYLEETNGLMECEQCHYVVSVTPALILSGEELSSPSCGPMKQITFADLPAREHKNESRLL